MIRDLLSRGCYLIDIPVCISGELKKAKKKSPNNELIMRLEANLSVFCTHYQDKQYIKKSELLSFWKDETVPFDEKLLLTIIWGHPNYNLQGVYSSSTLSAITQKSPKINQWLLEMASVSDYEIFKNKLFDAFVNFEANGDWNIPQIGESFFTKFFHFFFASHPITSKPGFLPIIADKWILLCVYAEMIDNHYSNRTEIIECHSSSAANLRKHNGSAANAYVQFVEYYNEIVREYNNESMEIDSFMLEDYLYNRGKYLAQIKTSIDNRSLCIPPWISGRYTSLGNGMAIIYNNLFHQEVLFKGESAKLVNKILEHEYYQIMTPLELSKKSKIEIDKINEFIPSLIEIGLFVDHFVGEDELSQLKHKSIEKLTCDVNSIGGSENLPSTYDMADAEYRRVLIDNCKPFWASIELTYGCNENCIHCYNPCSPREKDGIKTVDQNELTLDDYRHLLDDMAEMGVVKLLFTGGDPFVKKDFIKILDYAHQKKFTVSVYTNGLALHMHPQMYAHLVDIFPYRVGLSIYNMDKKTHESITRVKGSLQKTIEIAKRLYNDGIVLEIKCPVMRPNYEGYSKVYEFAKKVCGITEFELNITSSNDGDTFAVSKLRLPEKDLKEILQDSRLPLSLGDGPIQSPDRTANMPFCNAGSDSFNLTPKGDIYPCLSFPMSCGNVKKTGIKEIWKNSDKLNNIRQLTYGDSEQCGKASYCKYCNRCIGQSYIESGNPVQASTDNCFIAKIREQIAIDKTGKPEPMISGN